MSNRVFKRVGGLKPRRSLFDLSYSKKFSADMGLLYPVQCDEVVPGDLWNMSNEIVIRFQPMVAPLYMKLLFIVILFCPISSTLGRLGTFYIRR